jgi:Ribbon-helix-helix protein, copG family
MPTSVRLDRKTESLIRQLARLAGRSKSWIIREAVVAYATVTPRGRAPYDALAPFLGAGGSGRPDLSARTGERFSDLVQTKNRARRSR